MQPANITAYIGLGSNVGDRGDNIRRAIESLGRTDGIEVVRTSRIAETKALGPPQRKYLNAVSQVVTSMPAEDLHAALTVIETKLGRQRSGKWGPRTMDLDLLLYGGMRIDTGGLVVPHPRMHLRSFVLDGLCQIDAALVHPVLGESMRELFGRLNGRNFAPDPESPRLVAVCGVMGVGKTTLAERLAKALGCRLVLESYEDNPFLPDVHMGRSESAMACQLHFLADRTAQLRAGSLAGGEAVVADYVFDKELVYAQLLLDQARLSLYRRVYRRMTTAVTRPVLLIYLFDSARNCLDRIRARGRPYERKIALRFLQRMGRLYGRLVDEWDKCPVMRVDARRFDCRGNAAVKRLAGQVRYYAAGC